MKRWRPVNRVAVVLDLAWVVLVWLALVWAVGCSRQLAGPGSGGTADSIPPPFDRVSDNGGISPTVEFTSVSIEKGTEITIRLRVALSSANSRVGDVFEAVLDEPVIIAGKTIAPRSAPVTGRVVATKASRSPHHPGYLRLTLASIALNGKIIPLQTSSIFAKGGAYEMRTPASADGSEKRENSAEGAAAESGSGSEASRDCSRGNARFSTGHGFTFRLSQPLRLPE